MPHHRRHSYDPRADSPPLIERLQAPPRRAGGRTTHFRSDSPPLIPNLITPPRTVRSLTPPPRAEARVRAVRPQATVGSRLYNLFRPRPRRVEVVETPVRVHRTVRVQGDSTPPPAPSTPQRRVTLRRRRPSPPPLVGVRSPDRRNINHGMSPRIPGGEYVPLPERQPEGTPPTPPLSRERQPKDSSRSPRRQAGYIYADPWEENEIVEQEEPHLVTQPEPVRKRVERRENVLAQPQDYREKVKRISRELEKKEADLVASRTRESELLQQLDDLRERAHRERRDVNAEIDELRARLRQCELERQDQQRLLEEERQISARRAQENQVSRRPSLRPRVIHHPNDDIEQRPSRPVRHPTNNTTSGVSAIRQAQADFQSAHGNRPR